MPGTKLQKAFNWHLTIAEWVSSDSKGKRKTKLQNIFTDSWEETRKHARLWVRHLGDHGQDTVASLRLWFHICRIWDNSTYPEGRLQGWKPGPQSSQTSVRRLTSSVSCWVWALGLNCWVLISPPPLPSCVTKNRLAFLCFSFLISRMRKRQDLPQRVVLRTKWVNIQYKS